MTSSSLARAGLCAAIYAVFTLLCLTVLQGLAWGPLQFRISECTVVLALFLPEAVPGLTIGCALANLINIPLCGSGIYGLLDVVFGSLATLLACLWIRHFAAVDLDRSRVKLALAGPVLFNAVIVSAYLPIVCAGMGYYTIPFTTIEIEGAFVAMYLFGLIATGIGEAVVVYALGLPLFKTLQRTGVLNP